MEKGKREATRRMYENIRGYTRKFEAQFAGEDVEKEEQGQRW